ncbi:hypothetical protein [Brevundimonas sp. Root1423]|uniref:hypothetical protein n=1 Tax=Brevundimonas sp. Root1423 TaxID=1736462 RepID=UPI0006FA9805|nr:hypothetical protein [Brevundimonas sp. Root1423]KQY96412.1 hypothetical protein ASD25_00540 [Brevundimonas sp. Root1423]
MGQPLRVVAAAYEVVVTTDDPRVVRTIISAPRPARHHNLAGLVHHGQERGLFADEQTVRNSGFLLSDGSYADRQRAADVAIAAGQITRDQMTIKGTLFSEDLW